MFLKLVLEWVGPTLPISSGKGTVEQCHPNLVVAHPNSAQCVIHHHCCPRCVCLTCHLPMVKICPDHHNLTCQSTLSPFPPSTLHSRTIWSLLVLITVSLIWNPRFLDCITELSLPLTCSTCLQGLSPLT